MNKVMGDYPGIEVVATVYGDDLADKSYREATGLMQTYPDLDAIIAPTSVGIVAAARAVEDAGKVGEVNVTGLGLPSEMAGAIDSGASKVLHGPEGFVPGFSKSEHEGGFRVSPLTMLPKESEDLQGLVISRTGIADLLCKPADGFEVVGQHGRTRIDDLPQQFGFTAEIGHQDFDQQIRAAPLHRLDAACDVFCTLIGQVVAVHRGQHRIAQIHGADGFGEPVRFPLIEGGGKTGAVHRTEPAAPGAGVPHEHESRRSAVPAFADVRALGFFADSAQLEGARALLDPVVPLSAWERDLQPGRLGRAVFESLGFVHFNRCRSSTAVIVAQHRVGRNRIRVFHPPSPCESSSRTRSSWVRTCELEGSRRTASSRALSAFSSSPMRW